MLCVSLVLERRGREVRRVDLRKPRTVVGRQVGCNVRIPSAEVSRQHCVLLVGENDLRVEDLNSVNGTYVNDVAVLGRQPVNPGDRLQIGPFTFIVEFAPVPRDFELDQPRLDSENAAPRPAKPAPEQSKSPAAQSRNTADLFPGEHVGRGDRQVKVERLEEVEDEDYVEVFEEVGELRVVEEIPQDALEEEDIAIDDDEPIMLPKNAELRGFVDGLEDSVHERKPGNP